MKHNKKWKNYMNIMSYGILLSLESISYNFWTLSYFPYAALNFSSNIINELDLFF